MHEPTQTYKSIHRIAGRNFSMIHVISKVIHVLSHIHSRATLKIRKFPTQASCRESCRYAGHLGWKLGRPDRDGWQP